MCKRISSSLVLLALAGTLPAQWNETGDAGQTLPGVQIPVGFSASGLSGITGTLTAGDVDMYLIDIVDPAAFSASTVGGATFDTQLFLFTRDGRGVTFDDDTTTGVQSTLTGTFVPCPGTYVLAISAYDVDPMASGQAIWNDSPTQAERRPDGPRRLEILDGWYGSPVASSTYTITLTGVNLYGREMVCPSDHYLTESDLQVYGAGSTVWWNETGGRFQVLYEGSHFVAAGASGNTWIDRMMFRGEDGNPNLGGQQWANVVVTIANTGLTPAAMTNNYANNLVGAANVQTATFATVTVAPSVGSMPNNYNIQLDLLAAIGGHSFNPTTENVLIDITLPTAATHPVAVGAVMPVQDTTGGTAVVRGAGVYSLNATATTGSVTSAPPVIGFKTDGAGWRPVIVARNEYFGAACGGSPASFYQGFLLGQDFDLTGFTMTPNTYPNPQYYTVTGTAPAFDATKVNAAPNSTADDGSVDLPLGYTFTFPGGTTATVRGTTNGYAFLAAGGSVDYSPTVDEFLGVTSNLPRLAPYWCDLHAGRNTATHPNSGMHVLNDTSGGAGNTVSYVTWFNVGAYETQSGTGVGGHAVYDFQIVLRQATGVIEFRYGQMPTYVESDTNDNPGYAAMVGFSRGTVGGIGAVDPQSRDLSLEVPFVTRVEGAYGNIGQRVLATPDVDGIAYGGRAHAGQTLTFDAVNVPPGTTLGVQLIDMATTRPGLWVPGILAPGCEFSVTAGALFHQVTLFPSGTVVGTVPVTIPAGVEGAELFAQFVVLDGLFGGPNLITAASNAVRVRVGLD
ncbi:MAG: hypothetical protein JNN13_02195 [Planctomycetes bacterium]|nr:hypothetical protein [Planctomycetota bacterium]